METRMIWANLSSGNLSKTREFYSQLGFKINGKHNQDELVSVSIGKDNFIINFFTKSRMEIGINGLNADATKHNEILFSLSADSREEVDQWVEKVKTSGGTLYADPQNYQEGYTFGFCDPDGHKFNVLYWPGM